MDSDFGDNPRRKLSLNATTTLQNGVNSNLDIRSRFGREFSLGFAPLPGEALPLLSWCGDRWLGDGN